MFFFCSLISPAQTPFDQLIFKKNKFLLSSIDPQINDIIQDKLGFMWFATQNGLFRFDGIKTDVFKHKSNDVLSVLHNRILDLEIDRKGRLWITTSGGVSYFDPNKRGFVAIFSKSKNTKKDVFSKTIQVDSKNKIWFTTSHYLWSYDQESKVLDSISVPKLKDKFGEPYIHTMCSGANNKLYLSIDRALYEYNKQTNAFFCLYAIPKEQNDMVLNIVEDTLGRFWTISRNGNLQVYNAIKKQYLSQDNFEKTKIKEKYFSAYSAKTGKLYFACFHGGMAQFNFVTNKIEPLNNQYFNYLDSKKVNAIFEDTQGILWLTHPENGVSYAFPNQNFRTIDQLDFNFQNLRSNVCSSILVDNFSALWIGSGIGGLHKVASQNQCISFYTAGIFKEGVSSLYADGENQIWVGTFDKGVFVLDKNGNKIKHFKEILDVRKIIRDKNGIFWFVSHGHGIYSLDLDKNIVVAYNSLKNKFLSPLGDWTFDIICAKDNSIFVASNWGLSVINPQRSKIKHYTAEKNKCSALVSNELRTLLEDSNGNIWCGTLEGISILDRQNDCFKHSLGQEGIFVVSLVEDNFGMVWAGTDIGLYKIDLKGKIINHFTIKNGLASNSFLERSALLNKNGDLIFGTNKGVLFFNPQKIKVYNLHSLVAISSVVINEKDITSPVFYENHTKQNGQWLLSHLENNFTFNLSALNFINAENNTFVYRLIGLDTDWKKINDPKISFSNLEPGAYTFEVKAINNDGIISKQSALFAFEIRNSFWKSWYAIFLYFTFILGVLYLIYRVAKLKLESRNDLLVERTKTEQLEELYESKINFFTTISHDIRTPLSLIYGPIEALLLSSKLEDKQKELLSMVQRNTKQLLKLVNELLAFKKFESDTNPLHLDLVNFTVLLTQLIEDFKLAAFQKNITFDFIRSDRDLFVNANANMLERACQNLLANAFKFTPKQGKIVVKLSELEVNNDFFSVLEIQDSGSGISKDDIDKIFNQFYEGKNSTGTGLGLFIVKKILDQIKGEITCENREGALFTVTLPLTKNTSFLNTPAPDPKVVWNIKSMKSKVVLIVEDNVELRSFIVQLLSQYFTVIEAENGKIGFEMALHSTPDLILTDVMMPEIDGLALCSNIKSSLQTSHIPVLMLTAKNNFSDELSALKIGADDYIEKPFDPMALILKVRNVLETKVNLVSKGNSQQQDHTADSIETLDFLFIQDFKKFIQKEYANADLSVEFLCNEMALSRSQMYKKVIALIGKSPVDYIQEIRMREAMHLIKTTVLSISEISFRVGYNDSRYFSSRFKKHTGLTPLEYRDKGG